MFLEAGGGAALDRGITPCQVSHIMYSPQRPRGQPRIYYYYGSVVAIAIGVNTSAPSAAVRARRTANLGSLRTNILVFVCLGL